MDPIGRLLSVGLILASLMTAPAPRPAWAAPGRLSHALAPDSRILRFVIGPDDHTVVYSVSIAGQPTEIWRTSIQAPAPVKLAETFVDDADSDPRRPSFRLTVDGSAVVFRSGVAGLSYVMMGGGGAAPLTPPMPAGAEVRAYDVLDDGTVIYLADQEVLGQPQLYRVPGDSDTAERVSPLTPSGHYVLDYAISSDQAYAVYAFGQPDSISTDPKSLYSVALAGPTFGGMLLGTAWPGWFLITGDGQHVVFERYRDILSVPIEGSTSPTVVVPAGSEAITILYDIARDGSAFLFAHRSLFDTAPRHLLNIEDLGRAATLDDVQILWSWSSPFGSVTGAEFAAAHRYAILSVPGQLIAQLPPSAIQPHPCCSDYYGVFDNNTWILYVDPLEKALNALDLDQGISAESAVLQGVSHASAIDSLRLNTSSSAYFIIDEIGLWHGSLPGEPRAAHLLVTNVAGQTRVAAYDLTSNEATVVYRVEAVAADQMGALYAISVPPIPSQWLMLPAIARP